MKKLPIADDLEKQCQELGIDITGEPRTQSSSGNRPRATDFELQRRFIEAQRSAREHNLWIVALISAIASLFSALAAWIAVGMGKKNNRTLALR